jgi:hypothetical protein
MGQNGIQNKSLRGVLGLPNPSRVSSCEITARWLVSYTKKPNLVHTRKSGNWFVYEKAELSLYTQKKQNLFCTRKAECGSYMTQRN